MAETNRAWSALQTLLGDNSDRAISAQDLRDALYSFSQIWGGMSVSGGTTTTTLTSSGTWYQLDLADFTDHASGVGIVSEKANDRIVLPAVAGVYLLTAGLVAVGSATLTIYDLKAEIDGADIAGAYSSYRTPGAGVLGNMGLVAPIVWGAGGNGYVTFHAKSNSGAAPTFKLTDGGIWIRRIA